MALSYPRPVIVRYIIPVLLLPKILPDKEDNPHTRETKEIQRKGYILERRAQPILLLAILTALGPLLLRDPQNNLA